MQDPGLSIASLGATLLTLVAGFIATALKSQPCHGMQDPGLSIASLGATLLTPVAGFIATQPALLAVLAQANLIADVNAGLPMSLHPEHICVAQH